MPLCLLAGLVLTACGVPTAAEDLATTPEPTAIAGSANFERPPDTTVEIQTMVAAPALTPEAGIGPLPNGHSSPAASPTPVATATPMPTATLIPTPFGTPPPTPTPRPSPADLAAEAFNLINKYRADYGRPALRPDPSLTAAAAAYAKLIAETGWFNCGCDPHRGPDGSEPAQRIARAGYGGRFRGETLNGGQGTPYESVVTWLNSPRHAAILLDAGAVDAGAGYYYNPRDIYGHHWVFITAVP